METNRDGLARLTLSVGGEAVLVNGYADVRKIFSDARFSRDLVASGSPRFWSNEVYVHPDMLLNIDGARHARLRRTLVPVFGPRLLARCRDRLDAVALEQARRLATLPAPADLVTEYAFPLAARMLCELTGASEHFDGLLDWMVRTAQAPRDRDEEKVFVDACAVHAGQLLQVRPAVPPLDTLVA
ncbi:MAG TPA: hypothetical protein VJX66_31555, partial [Amycolatopsis sp.]|nr:hypothetical protein [Amycolatopsis sp.]